MFGHVNPPGVYHELTTLAKFITGSDAIAERPLDGLRVFIMHIKDSLIPHPTGRTARQIIMGELKGLEREGNLGVEFIELKKGDRICEFRFNNYSLMPLSDIMSLISSPIQVRWYERTSSSCDPPGCQ